MWSLYTGVIMSKVKGTTLIQPYKGWASKNQIQKLVKTHGQERVDRVLLACENIWKLPEKLGLGKKELFSMALYIETKLKGRVKKGEFYLRKEKTGLARTIEYDPKSHKTFIHLKTHNVNRVGKGCHKRVTLSIMYRAHTPEVVVNSVGDETILREAKALKMLKGKPGIVPTYAMTQHVKKKTHEKVYSLIQKHYNAHSMRSYHERNAQITKKECVKMAKDIFSGLEAMHEKRLAHLDLHRGNILCNRSSKGFECALIDFGQTRSFDAAKERVPQVEVPRRFVTPESLVKGKHRVDVRKIEVFAIGWNLLYLYFKKEPGWADNKKFYELKKMSRHDKKKFQKELIHDINKSLKSASHKIRSRNKEWVTFGKMILKMCDVDPKKRQSATTLRKQLGVLLTKM